MNKVLRIAFSSLGAGLLMFSLLLDPLRGKPLTIGYYQILVLTAALLLLSLGIFQKQPVLLLQELIAPLQEWKNKSIPLSTFWRGLF